MNQTHLCTCYFLIDNSDIIRSNEIAQKQNHLRYLLNFHQSLRLILREFKRI